MRSRVIAVAGVKGSSGATFVAVGLASRLAGQRIPTLLLDADAEAAGVASHLDLRGSGVAVPALTAGVIAAAAERKDGFSCLDIRGLDGAARHLLAAAQESYPAVVIDLGHDPGAQQRELSAAADWLLWVVAPDRIGVERADRAIGAGQLTASSAAIVLNRAGSGFRDAGLVLGERHGLPLATVIRERRWAARESVRRCLAPDRFRAFRTAFGELARCVHPDAQAGAGAAWP